MNSYQHIQEQLNTEQSRWTITGVAGFIGSNLLEFLLRHNQKVTGLDNFSTGYRHNFDQVRELVGTAAWKNFSFIEGDICNLSACQSACTDADFVLHHAALGSVPRSIEDPILTNASNVSGYLNMLVAARDQKVRRFVYAASSSPTEIIPTCRKSNPSSACRCRPTPLLNTSTNSMPTYFSAVMACPA